jgi:phosphoenolpyruvate synthase/pyruvate phosphate dikinase
MTNLGLPVPPGFTITTEAPDSVHFFHQAGLDNVSCSPFRVPVARLEAAFRQCLELLSADDGSRGAGGFSGS